MASQELKQQATAKELPQVGQEEEAAGGKETERDVRSAGCDAEMRARVVLKVS